MTPLQLAWRTTKRYRLRALLAIAGVAVIGALLFDMLLLSHGLLLSFADLLKSEGFEIRVVAREGFVRVPIPQAQATAAAIAALPAVDDVAQIRMEQGEARAGARQSGRLTIIGRAETRQAKWRVLSGEALPDRAPATDCPVVIDRRLSTMLDLRPGAKVQVTALPSAAAATAIPPLDCRVTGIVDFGFGSLNESTIATRMETLHRLVGEQEPGNAELILVALKEGSDAAAASRDIAKLRPDLHVYSNDDVVAQFNRNGFAYFRQISGVLSALTTAFAFLLIATLLTVSVNQRLGEIAALRALGIARRRIAAMLLWESALLVGAGALLALPLGGAIAVVLDRILRQMPGLPEALHFFVFEPRALAIHIAVFVVTASASAAYPIWLASTLPIAATLRREVVG